MTRKQEQKAQQNTEFLSSFFFQCPLFNGDASLLLNVGEMTLQKKKLRNSSECSTHWFVFRVNSSAVQVLLQKINVISSVLLITTASFQKDDNVHG